MRLIVASTYSRTFKKGDIVEVDAIRYSLSLTGIQFRVIGVWKEPRWLDSAWFLDHENRHLALVTDEEEI